MVLTEAKAGTDRWPLPSWTSGWQLLDPLSHCLPSRLVHLTYQRALPLHVFGVVWSGPLQEQPGEVTLSGRPVEVVPDPLSFYLSADPVCFWQDGQLYARNLTNVSVPCVVSGSWAYPMSGAELRSDCPLYLKSGETTELLDAGTVQRQNGALYRVLLLGEGSGIVYLVGTPVSPTPSDMELITEHGPLLVSPEFTRTSRSSLFAVISSRQPEPLESELRFEEIARMAGAERIWSPLDPVYITEWDGVSTLDLPEHTYQVEIQGVPQWRVVRFRLRRDGERYVAPFNLHYGAWIPWYGHIQATGRYVQMEYTEQELLCIATVKLWDTDNGADGSVRRLLPTYNLPKSTYKVFAAGVGLATRRSSTLSVLDSAYDLFHYSYGALIVRGRCRVSSRSDIRCDAIVISKSSTAIGGYTSISLTYTIGGIRSGSAVVRGSQTASVTQASIAHQENASALLEGGTQIDLQWEHTIPVQISLGGYSSIRAYPGVYLIADGSTAVNVSGAGVFAGSAQVDQRSDLECSARRIYNATASITGSSSASMQNTSYRAGVATVPGSGLVSADATRTCYRSMVSSCSSVIRVEWINNRTQQVDLTGYTRLAVRYRVVHQPALYLNGSTQIDAYGLGGNIKYGSANVSQSTSLSCNGARLQYISPRLVTITTTGSTSITCSGVSERSSNNYLAGRTSINASYVAIRPATLQSVPGSCQMQCTASIIRHVSINVQDSSSLSATGSARITASANVSCGTTTTTTVTVVRSRGARVDQSTIITEVEVDGYSPAIEVVRGFDGQVGENTIEPTDTESLNILNNESSGSTTQEKLIRWQYYRVAFYLWGRGVMIKYRKDNPFVLSPPGGDL